ncbi:RNA methyltransferase [Shewanella sp. 202IG2-18]|uniref:RNA methyltransferase n=1 Tax=Parashewanella hymeniacidonis TaxID=2807618 RepID=UPI001961F020|nr:RNA methyltransferase [Parashewanella hymeniacidonis]MBM7070650.1 RNA methyltransferase [Parashewanella hymeniacidonis]
MSQPFVAIGLQNPKTPINVDGIMRACGCYQANAVFYTGRRYELALRSSPQYQVDTKKAAQHIPMKKVESLLEADVPENCNIICVDFVEGATPLPEFEHPENAFYIFGPEDGTVRQELVDRADAVVYVPTIGCMNLAASVNVLLYDRLSKASNTSSESLNHNQHIQQNRDTNNRVKVRN